MTTIIPVNPLDNLVRIEYKGHPVLTTPQVAEVLSTPEKVVTTFNLLSNFSYNASRYVEGKHYFKLVGEELKAFKNDLRNSGVVTPRVNKLYLRAKRGFLHHCKSVNTDVAWQVYEYLEDTYFKVQEILQTHEKLNPTVSDVELAAEMRKLACHSKDPYKREKLVTDAANLLYRRKEFNEPDEQLNLFYH